MGVQPLLHLLLFPSLTAGQHTVSAAPAGGLAHLLSAFLLHYCACSLKSISCAKVLWKIPSFIPPYMERTDK